MASIWDIDPSDADPQSAAAAEGWKKLLSDTPGENGSAQPTWSPLDAIPANLGAEAAGAVGRTLVDSPSWEDLVAQHQYALDAQPGGKDFLHIASNPPIDLASRRLVQDHELPMPTDDEINNLLSKFRAISAGRGEPTQKSAWEAMENELALEAGKKLPLGPDDLERHYVSKFDPSVPDPFDKLNDEEHDRWKGVLRKLFDSPHTPDTTYTRFVRRSVLNQGDEEN